MTSTLRRALAPAVIALLATLPAHAQPQNPNCSRLETQLASFDRSNADPARAEQIKRFEEAAATQQIEIERQQATGRRMGCERNSFYVLFSGQPAACGPLNAKIQQMQANLDRIQADLGRLQGAAGPERDAQRRAILVALAQNNCGAQYSAQVAATQPRSGGFFETLFGPGSRSVLAPADPSPGWSSPGGGSYRTICVRTCDGFFWPVSFATDQSRFQDDERTCQRSCPAAEVVLYSHRNPGEDVSQAVSLTGQLYSTLPNAFKYRQAFDNSCSCRAPGETWANALRNLEDSTVEQGDIVVNEERARQLSQPRFDAQGRPIRPDSRPAARPSPRAQSPAAAPAPAETAERPAEPAQPAAPVKPDPNRTVRSVGPIFMER
jgi:Protein of unknown function (DUF2865)